MCFMLLKGTLSQSLCCCCFVQKQQKPAYIEICCNMASLPHPSFTDPPIPIALAQRHTNKGGVTPGSCTCGCRRLQLTAEHTQAVPFNAPQHACNVLTVLSIWLWRMCLRHKACNLHPPYAKAVCCTTCVETRPAMTVTVFWGCCSLS
jgi:hypothetical protein